MFEADGLIQGLCSWNCKIT